VSSIFRDLANQFGPEAARSLSRRIGAREGATARALAAAVPTVMSVFARVAASPGNAPLLLAGIEWGQEGRTPLDAAGALGSQRSASADAILDDALGERRGAVAAQIARPAGMDAVQASAVLAVSATLLLGALGRARRGRPWSAEDLARTLARELTSAEDAVPGSVGVLEELLEADADADIGDDVTEVGAQLLARLCEG
jgi:hypothetical protein